MKFLQKLPRHLVSFGLGLGSKEVVCIIWASSRENLSSEVCEQQMRIRAV